MKSLIALLLICILSLLSLPLIAEEPKPPGTLDAEVIWCELVPIGADRKDVKGKVCLILFTEKGRLLL